MIYLILDTNIWVYLANGLDPITNKHHDNLHFDLLKALKEHKQNNDICILINDIVIEEWERNKEHCKLKLKKLNNKVLSTENAFSDINKYVKTRTNDLQNQYAEGIKREILANEEHIQKVEEFLFNDWQKINISNDIKLKIFDLSVGNKAPFHNKKNNVADASILLSAADFLKDKLKGIDKSAIFVSNNFEDFTDGNNKNEFHPDISELLGHTEIKYERVLPAALKLSEKIILQIQEYDKIKALADFAAKKFTWDIQKEKRGALMFLDVPYQRDNQDSSEYLSFTIAKDYSKERPEFISVIIPNNIVQANGIFIKFGKTTKPNNDIGWKIDLENGNPVRVHFERCNDETCTVRIIGGYVTDEDTKEDVDIFQKFLDFDHVYFLFLYQDGSHKSVAVPLFSFKEQYKTLNDTGP